MKNLTTILSGAILAVAFVATGCVSSGTHEAVLAELAKKKKELDIAA